MMMGETELRPSPIAGIGIFVLHDVPKGSVIWRFDSRIDRVYSEADIASLPPEMRRFLRRFSTWHEQSRLWVLCGDNGRHFNHSDTPNTLSQGIAFGDDVAGEDIPAGSELTADYRTICDAVRLNGFDFEFGGAQSGSRQISTQRSATRSDSLDVDTSTELLSDPAAG
jgi:uncharacterized protein